MPKRKKLLSWWGTLAPIAQVILAALAIPLLVLNVWALMVTASYFHSLLTILIAAALLAFLLNYPVSFMQRHGARRGRAAVIIFLLAIAIVVGLGLTLLPIALQQARQLVFRLPHWIDANRHQLMLLDEQFKNSGFPLSLDVLAEQINGPLKNQIQGATGEALNVALFTVSSLLDLLLTFVLAFYLLQHGNQIWGSLLEWLPVSIRQPFAQTLRLSFQNFFLGQLILATCIGLTLTLIFLVLGVPFGLLFGLMIGVLALIPYGGSVGIVLVTVLVMLQNFTLGLKVLMACLIVQQIIENAISPRILGSVTGLNPVWIFVSILTGARVGGLLGVIVAVPIAVVIKSALVAIRTSRITQERSSQTPAQVSDIASNAPALDTSKPLSPEQEIPDISDIHP